MLKSKNNRMRLFIVCLVFGMLLFALEGCGYWAALYDMKPLKTVKVDAYSTNGVETMATLEKFLEEQKFSVNVVSASSTSKTGSLRGRKKSMHVFATSRENEGLEISIYPSKMKLFRPNLEKIDEFVGEIETVPFE